MESGAEKPFFIEYFLCNPALGGDKPVFGQLHRFFGWKDVTVHGQALYRISADDCLASDSELRGSMAFSQEDALAHPEYMCDAGALK